MALIEIDSIDDPFDGLFDGSVVEDDVRCFSSQFEREFFPSARDGLRDPPPHASGAGESNFVDTIVADEVFTGIPCPGHNIDDAIGQPRFLKYFSEVHRGDGSGLPPASAQRCFHRPAAGAIFQAAIRSGKYHGITCPATPTGFGLRPGKSIVEFIGPTGVVKKVGCGRAEHQRRDSP